MRGGGSVSRVAGAGAETGGGLTGAGAAGVAVAIDAVGVGAGSWTDSGLGGARAGAETSGLTGGAASGVAVAIDGASRWSRVLDGRPGPEAVVDEDARGKRCDSAMGMMSVDFMVMGLSSILPKES